MGENGAEGLFRTSVLILCFLVLFGDDLHFKRLFPIGDDDGSGAGTRCSPCRITPTTGALAGCQTHRPGRGGAFWAF